MFRKTTLPASGRRLDYAIALSRAIDACGCSCLDCGQAGVLLWYRGFDKLVGVNTLGADMDAAGP